MNGSCRPSGLPLVGRRRCLQASPSTPPSWRWAPRSRRCGRTWRPCPWRRWPWQRRCRATSGGPRSMHSAGAQPRAGELEAAGGAARPWRHGAARGSIAATALCRTAVPPARQPAPPGWARVLDLGPLWARSPKPGRRSPGPAGAARRWPWPRSTRWPRRACTPTRALGRRSGAAAARPHGLPATGRS